MALTRGLVWSIPIKFDPDARLIHELEQLMPDFWKFELENKDEYNPTDIKTGHPMLFDLMYFFDKLKPLETDYAVYLGSQDTPPCLDNVFYLINFKPLPVPNCQFKIYRENSLLTNRERETHARTLRENTKGGPAQVRRVTPDAITPITRPTIPVEPKPPAPGEPEVVPQQTITKFNANHPPKEIYRSPNCELKREMGR